MTLQIADRIWDTTTTTGTVTITLANSPPNAYSSFGSVCANGDTIYYALAGRTSNVWEVGLGTYGSAGPTLARTTVLASSSGGSAVSLSGTTDVLGVWPANQLGKNFTSSSAGWVPASGGGTTNFLRADGTFAVPPGAVASVSNSDSTLTISPTTGSVVASLNLGHANTWTAAQTFNSGDLLFAGATSGTTTVNASATASGTLTLPAATDTLVARGTTDTLTNKTLTSSTNTLGGVTVGFGSDATGDIYFDNAGVLTRLAIGSTNNVLTVIAGKPSWQASSGGSPGGANTDVQFNNSSAFGGDGGFTYAGNGQATLALGTITSNAKALNITGTWNASGVTFDAPLFANITNTASHAGSALFDFQVGGNSQFAYYPNASTLELGNSTTATVAHFYNTVDTLGGPTNYERFTIDWAAEANVVHVGMEKGGTGSPRIIRFINAGQNIFWKSNDTGFNDIQLQRGSITISGTAGQGVYGWTNGNDVASSSIDTGLFRGAASVVAFSDGGGNHNGWLNWSGELRTTSATNYTNATPTTIMSVALAAGRTYSFDGYIPVTAGGTAGGVQVVLNASGGLTATAIQADSIITSNNVHVGQVSVSSITTLSSAVMGAATGYVEFHGTITVNVAGTLNFQTAQSSTNATTMTIGRGARVFLYDMP